MPPQGPQAVERLFPLAAHDAVHCNHPLTESASAGQYDSSPQPARAIMGSNSPLLASRSIARRGSIGSSGERRDSFAMDEDMAAQGMPLMSLNSNSRNSSPYRRSRSLSLGCMQTNGLMDDYSPQKFDLIETVRRHSMEWSSADTERYQAQFASAVRCATALPVEVTDLVFAYCYDPNNPPVDRLKFLADIDRLGLDETENRPSPDLTPHRRLSVPRSSRADGEELPFIKESNNASILQGRQAGPNGDC